MASCLLKQIPRDIYDFLIDVQSGIKKNRQINVYSLESTIYKILNDSRKCVEDSYKKEFETEHKK